MTNNKNKHVKIKALAVLCLISSMAWGQTLQLEKKSLNERFTRGDFSVEDYAKFAKDWRDMIASFGGYPELPYDSVSGHIKFEMVEQTGQPKHVNYQRIMEWAAINFGSLNSVLHYENYESGKIILKGSFDVTHKNIYGIMWGKPLEALKTTRSKQTYIFSIKDNVIKAEIVDVRYEFFVYGYSAASQYIPDRTYEISIHNVYPITNFDSMEWKEKLDLLYQTNLKIKGLIGDLVLYIKDYNDDMNF